MAKKILIVSSEKNLARFTSIELQQADLSVTLAEDGRAALKSLQERDFDLILVDFQLPDMTGQAFAEDLSRFKPASVIITVASREEAIQYTDVIQRYAVSCLVKPFVVTELIETISRIFRGRDYIDQHCSQVKRPMACRDLRIDTEQHTVFRGEKQLILTRREYDLLATLLSSSQPLSREQLLDRVWKYEAATETNVVDVYIRYLRGKIDLKGQPSYIQTVRGVGYSMRWD